MHKGVLMPQVSMRIYHMYAQKGKTMSI